MPKKLATYLLVLSMMVVGFSLLAEAQQAIKVAIINSQEILEKSIEGKKAIAQLEDRNRKNQQICLNLMTRSGSWKRNLTPSS